MVMDNVKLFDAFIFTWSLGTVIFSSSRLKRPSMAYILLLSSLICIQVVGGGGGRKKWRDEISVMIVLITEFIYFIYLALTVGGMKPNIYL